MFCRGKYIKYITIFRDQTLESTKQRKLTPYNLISEMKLNVIITVHDL